MSDFLKRPLTDRVKATNHSKIAWIVCHIKPSKVPGSHKIVNIILQHLPRLVLKFITKIFNRSFALNYFPTHWKEAKIVMLPKPGNDHTSALIFRLTNLLVGKRFENIILKRLNFQLWELKVIRNDQYGFKRGHSTTHALLRNSWFLKENTPQHMHC
jgi:hypothetical protein